MFSGQNVYSKIYTFINTGQRAVVPFKQHGGIAVPSTGFRFAGGTLQPQQRTIQWTQHLVRGDILGFLYDTEKDQCQLFKNGEMMEGVFFRNLSMLHKRGQVYFYVELSVRFLVYLCSYSSTTTTTIKLHRRYQEMTFTRCDFHET